MDNMKDKPEYFSDRLFHAVAEKGTPLCVGFDPHIDMIPEHLLRKYTNSSADKFSAYSLAVEEFLFRILDAVYPLVGVIKPQFAFFERLGADGMRVLAKICKAAQERGLVVIGDAKRGDIGSTAGAYAAAYLHSAFAEPPPAIPTDALTVNPYLGWDAILPFIDTSFSAGVFVLVKTSNPSGGMFQDILTPEGTIAEIVGKSVAELGKAYMGKCGYSNVGAVVGATYPEQAGTLRNLMPQTPFLIPGYGHQGAGAQAAVASIDSNGTGGIINSSRGIIFAYRNKKYSRFDAIHFADAAARACTDAIEDIRTAIQQKNSSI